MKREIKILGQIIRHGEIQIEPGKVEAINKCSLPTTDKELRSFLGMANYCRAFIPNYSDCADPLYKLLAGKSNRSNAKIEHTEESRESFNTLKKKIKTHVVRAQPNFKKPFIVITDASTRGILVILAQISEDGTEMMISCFSKALS